MGFIISQHVHSVIDPDGAVLLDVKGGRYWSLNGVGADIWSGIEAGLSVTEITEHIRERYDGADADITADVDRFISRLLTCNLIAAS